MNQIISVLVVDDEDSTRQILTKYIDWNNLGVTNVYEATDGRLGLKVALSVKPQIIISDIKMPYMNGIEFAEEIKKVMPDSKFVFLSGYADKEYLKSAIKLKATSFIEKPIDMEEISLLVRELVSECMKEEEEKKDLMLFSEQQLVLNITSQDTSDELITSLIQKKSCFATSTTFTTSVVNFHVSSDSLEFASYQDALLTHLTKDHCIIGIRNDGMLILIYALIDMNYATFIIRLSAAIDEILATYTNSSIFVSSGSEVNSLAKLKESSDIALKGLSRCFFTGTNKVSIPKNTVTCNFELDHSTLPQLEVAFKTGNQIMAEVTIQQMLQKIRDCEDTSPEYIKNIFYQFTFSLRNIAEYQNLSLHTDCCNLLNTISKLETLSEIEDAFGVVMKSFFKHYRIAHAESEDPLLRINNFLKLYYQDPELNINYIAKNLHFTPSYLCAVFKKGTGKTINQYIATLRIEKAKELLLIQDKKLYDIANKVGYTDGKYFTKVFTKTVGISPKQYRERHITNE